MKSCSIAGAISQFAVTGLVSCLAIGEQPSLAYSIKSLSSQKLSSGSYRTTIIMPMKDAGDSWDERIVFIVRCSTREITRSDGVTPATGTFPRVFLDEVIKRTCRI